MGARLGRAAAAQPLLVVAEIEAIEHGWVVSRDDDLPIPLFGQLHHVAHQLRTSTWIQRRANVVDGEERRRIGAERERVAEEQEQEPLAGG